MDTNNLRLGVNIDHVATIRNARGGIHPDPVWAAQIAFKAGADGITAHLREDRRHIRDEDIAKLVHDNPLPLNLEMAATDEMLSIALRHKPHAVCIVPEKRQEITTEGGLDIIGQEQRLIPYINALKQSGSKVSLFIEADANQIHLAKKLGADVIELHTGAYAEAIGDKKKYELERLINGAATAKELNIECHAGHGLTYDNVIPIAEIPTLTELNIGHFLIGEAIFVGLEASIREMRRLMDKARGKV